MVHLSDNSEEEALLTYRLQREPRSSMYARLKAWKAHPFWLIPIVLMFSMCRGITMAPRIQVYTEIACRALEGVSANASATDCSGSGVQARAARIQASVTTTMSVLSALTTGPWSRFGDAHGRKPILSLTIGGAIAMDLVFLLVSRSSSVFAEKFILMGPILDGLVGGLSAFNGVVHAYTSDCTRHGSRSKIFSTIQGMVFVGLAMGPWFGKLVLPAQRSSTSLFYLSLVITTMILAFVIFLCPESREPTPVPDHEESTFRVDDNYRATSFPNFRLTLKRLSAALVSPIAMFAPRVAPGRTKKDYNLTFLGLGLFIYLISIGVYQSKYMYAQHIYSWTTTQLGYYMSLLWISRAVNLLVLLPLIISYFKPKFPVAAGAVPPPGYIAAELRFDKNLARCSLAVDGLADFLVAVTPTTAQYSFIALSCLSSFTSGGNPSLHSLGAVCLHACGSGSEVGSLFGAMAVLSAIAHIVSPYVYALTYGSTVARYPQAIFALASIMLTTVVILLSRIQPLEGGVVQPEEEQPLRAEESEA